MSVVGVVLRATNWPPINNIIIINTMEDLASSNVNTTQDYYLNLPR